MKRQITLNQALFEQVIKEAVENALNDQLLKITDVSSDFEAVANNLKFISENIYGFIEEYPNFVQKMEDVMADLGFEMDKDIPTKYFNLDDVYDQSNAQFFFNYALVSPQNNENDDRVIDNAINTIKQVPLKYGTITCIPGDDDVSIYYQTKFYE